MTDQEKEIKQTKAELKEQLDLKAKEVEELNNKLVRLEKKQELSVPANEIATQFFNPAVWAQMKGMAEVFAKSGALPPDINMPKTLMAIQAGYEMGMKPIESISSLDSNDSDWVSSALIFADFSFLAKYSGRTLMDFTGINEV